MGLAPGENTNANGNTTYTQDANGGTSPGPGYGSCVQTGPQSIATLGPPVSDLPYIETASNVAAVITAVYESGGRPVWGGNVGGSGYGGQWEGATAVLLPVGGTSEFPGISTPTPSFNMTNGITSTQQLLENKLEIEAPQEGTPAINVPIPFNGGIAASAVQTFRWE